MAFITPTPVTARSRIAGRAVSCPTSSRCYGPSMVAMEPKTPTKLSNRATQLLSYVRGHKSIFQAGKGFTSTRATLFRKNDTGRCFTPLDELATNAHVLPAGSVAATMLVQADDLVDRAFAHAVSQFPALEQDQVLKEIFTHDIRVLLRVISYGAACQSTDFIHQNNIGVMKLLHKEVAFPDGLVAGAVRAAKDAVLDQVNDPSLIDTTADCFEVISSYLS